MPTLVDDHQQRGVTPFDQPEWEPFDKSMDDLLEEQKALQQRQARLSGELRATASWAGERILQLREVGNTVVGVHDEGQRQLASKRNARSRAKWTLGRLGISSAWHWVFAFFRGLFRRRGRHRKRRDRRL